MSLKKNNNNSATCFVQVIFLVSLRPLLTFFVILYFISTSSQSIIPSPWKMQLKIQNPLNYRKVIMCTWCVLCNSPSGVRQHLQSNKIIYLQWNTYTKILTDSCQFSCVLLLDELQLDQVLPSTESQQTEKNTFDSQRCFILELLTRDHLVYFQGILTLRFVKYVTMGFNS